LRKALFVYSSLECQLKLERKILSENINQIFFLLQLIGKLDQKNSGKSFLIENLFPDFQILRTGAGFINFSENLRS